ncbi:hypothetical protein LCGC14_0381500 [marine sediment metagenome]|uniref:Uncharacterized protein n=1 Tax=marine sediment metagenome TaxID=412755 RepID=A0A0F9WAZ4_9ZZZZ
MSSCLVVVDSKPYELCDKDAERTIMMRDDIGSYGPLPFFYMLYLCENHFRQFDSYMILADVKVERPLES